MMRPALMGVLLIVAIGCGGRAPTTPSTPSGSVVNLAGVWTGTLESANFSPRTLTLTIAQGGNCVDGAWITTTSDWTGAISGFAAASSFSGQLSFERSADGGGKCTAAGSIAGDAGPDAIRWTSPGVDAVGSCTGDLPRSIVVTLKRSGA